MHQHEVQRPRAMAIITATRGTAELKFYRLVVMLFILNESKEL